jgi:Uma2 family endonuclease
MVALARIPIRMSVAEFLAWEPGDGRAWQLVDGEPQAMSPANRSHGTLQNELGSLIRNHLRAQGSPCTVVTTPGVVPHVNAGMNMRVPDLAVTCAPYEAEETALTDPVLIVEILSPSNQAETWANVWAYTTIPSVREILVLRTATIGAEILRRQPDAGWPQDPEQVTQGHLDLASIGLRLPLIDIYAGTRLHPPRNP